MRDDGRPARPSRSSRGGRRALGRGSGGLWARIGGLGAIAALLVAGGQLTRLEAAAEAQAEPMRAGLAIPAADRITRTSALVDCPAPKRHLRWFTAAARDTGVPLNLLVAMGYVESEMNQGARSHAGALGLLQLLPTTAAELRLDPMEARTNVLAGARYLARMHERFGSLDLALAAYNAGPTAVERAGGPPWAETRAYVANVRARAAKLTGCR